MSIGQDLGIKALKTDKAALQSSIKYSECFDIEKPVSKMVWKNEVPNNRSLLVRKTFLVKSQDTVIAS